MPTTERRDPRVAWFTGPEQKELTTKLIARMSGELHREPVKLMGAMMGLSARIANHSGNREQWRELCASAWKARGPIEAPRKAKWWNWVFPWTKVRGVA